MGAERKDPPIRKRSGEIVGRVADETVVPVKSWKHE
jgi:hypothetical protein